MLRNTKEEHLTGGSIVTHPAVEDKNKGFQFHYALKSTKEFNRTECFSFRRGLHLAMSYTPAWTSNLLLEGLNKLIPDSKFWDSPLFIRKENPPVVLLAQLDSKPRIMGSAKLLGYLETPPILAPP